jgi:hypothetical protein
VVRSAGLNPANGNVFFPGRRGIAYPDVLDNLDRVLAAILAQAI